MAAGRGWWDLASSLFRVSGHGAGIFIACLMNGSERGVYLGERIGRGESRGPARQSKRAHSRAHRGGRGRRRQAKRNALIAQERSVPGYGAEE